MIDKYIPIVLQQFARLLNIDIENNRLDIPAEYGAGYCSGYVFNEHIRILISNYELHQDLIISNPNLHSAGKVIFFKFQNIFTKADNNGKALTAPPSVLIATSRINTDELIAIHSNTATINIEVQADYLNSIFDTDNRSPILQSLLDNKQPLVFEQLIYPSLQKVVDEILAQPASQNFKLFLLRIKAEELICKLLMELEKREEEQIHALNIKDIQTIYNIKEQILKQLHIPPVIDKLAIEAGMSPTKLKRLFRQIFGDSIFSYYQTFRMKEAARLLTEEKLSVSAVGYSLGFTNLSHFTRVFNEHIGMKPKQYSTVNQTGNLIK
ncbi:helix-turn-helix transcriptional regulator [Mucilaginibacter sp. JRF]|uniref:helix-turn-helix transcriptional regulator n=1 Tax=Mucilaginibacter sp. JRF TaxID=2780088 RepID=UPI0018829A94|nr:AraC family transcriptional regulator [Mucilaginibacter sp. JRF]MBE9585273.1 helix-turn-helix transcriptional regulator [Mucilaginibacter sp. JRF]